MVLSHSLCFIIFSSTTLHTHSTTFGTTWQHLTLLLHFKLTFGLACDFWFILSHFLFSFATFLYSLIFCNLFSSALRHHKHTVGKRSCCFPSIFRISSVCGAFSFSSLRFVSFRFDLVHSSSGLTTRVHARATLCRWAAFVLKAAAVIESIVVENRYFLNFLYAKAPSKVCLFLPLLSNLFNIL